MLAPGTLLNLVEDICTEGAVNNNVVAEVVEECILGEKSDPCYPIMHTHTGMFRID